MTDLLTEPKTAPSEPELPDPRQFKNYGDCALNLPPDWSRGRNVGHPGFLNTTVGHENGVSDAYLKMDPGKAHQFRWCAPEDQDATSTMRTQHFEPCMKADWTKNAFLWMWDGEGYIVHNGQRLWARDKQYYLADKEAAAEEQKRRNQKTQHDDEQAEARAVAQGVTIEDDRGRELRPMRPR